MDFDAIARQIMLNHYAAYPDPERQTMAFIVDELRKAYEAGMKDGAELNFKKLGEDKSSISKVRDGDYITPLKLMPCHEALNEEKTE